MKGYKVRELDVITFFSVFYIYIWIDIKKLIVVDGAIWVP